MNKPSVDSSPDLRGAARFFVLETRERVRSMEAAGGEGAEALVGQFADLASTSAVRWGDGRVRRQFLIELASAARSEGMARFDAHGPAAQIYDRLAKRIDELRDADRS